MSVKINCYKNMFTILCPVTKRRLHVQINCYKINVHVSVKMPTEKYSERNTKLSNKANTFKPIKYYLKRKLDVVWKEKNVLLSEMAL